MVQALAVEMLHRQDTMETGQHMAEEFRLARVAAGVEPKQVYPEYFTQQGEAIRLPEAVEVATTAEQLDEVDLDAADVSGVDWRAPSGVSDDDMSRLHEFLADTHVRVSERDVPDGQPGEWL